MNLESMAMEQSPNKKEINLFTAPKKKVPWGHRGTTFATAQSADNKTQQSTTHSHIQPTPTKLSLFLWCFNHHSRSITNSSSPYWKQAAFAALFSTLSVVNGFVTPTASRVNVAIHQ